MPTIPIASGCTSFTIFIAVSMYGAVVTVSYDPDQACAEKVCVEASPDTNMTKVVEQFVDETEDSPFLLQLPSENFATPTHEKTSQLRSTGRQAGKADKGGLQGRRHRLEWLKEATSVANETLARGSAASFEPTYELAGKLIVHAEEKQLTSDELGGLTCLRVSTIISYFALICYMTLLLRECCCVDSDCLNLEPTQGHARDQLRRILGFGSSLAAATVSVLRSCIQTIVNLGGSDSTHPHGEIDFAKLEAELLRIEINRNCALCLVDILAIVLLLLAVFGAVDGVWGVMDGAVVGLYLHQWDYIGILYTFLACLLVVVCPKCVGKRTSRLYYILDVMRMTFLVFSINDCWILMNMIPINALSMLISSLICGDVCLTTTLNFITVFFQCWEYAYLAKTYVEPFPRHKETYIIQQVFLVCGTAFVCAFAQWALLEYVRFRRGFSSRSEAVVHGLLSVVCDAVVHVGPGPDFQITKPSPKLASLLVETDTPCLLEGRSFLDFVSDVDVLRFKELSQQDGTAQCLHVGLISADGKIVDVRLYANSFEESDGLQGHIIGVCELRDSATRELSCELSPSENVWHRGSMSDSGSSVFEGAGELETPGDLVPPLTNIVGGRKVAVVVDPFTQQLTIMNFTPAFAFIMAQTPEDEEGFLKYAVNPEKHYAAVQSYANAAASSFHASNRLNVTLRPPLAVELGFEIQAECVLSLDDNGIGNGNGNGNDKSNSGSQSEEKKKGDSGDELSSSEQEPMVKITLRKVRRRRIPSSNLPRSDSNRSMRSLESIESSDPGAGSPANVPRMNFD